MTYEEYLKNRREYQEYGHLFLLERKHACLFYKPGKGKTYPCIDAIRDVNQQRHGNACVLILSTADAIKNMWKAEIVPQNILPTNTTLMTFNTAIRDENKSTLLKKRWDVVVVDESHRIKAHNSQISRLVYRLTKDAEYAWGLSGTPRGNTDIDIYCQFHNLNISEWGAISYTKFIENYCDFDNKFFNGQHVKIPIGITKRYRAAWENNIAKYTQRIEYTEDDNMPELKVNVIKFDYVESKEYKNALDGFIKLSDYETTMTKLTAMMKAHQIVNGFMYYGDNKRDVYEVGHNIKLDWLKENIKPNNVIVYRYDADKQNILATLDNYKITETVEDFKAGNADILLLQCSRCESFNLQFCNRIVFYTLDYSYIKYNQMLHRIWRLGQKEQCDIDVLVFAKTVDEDIWDTVHNKEILADLFMKIKGANHG